MVATKLCVKLAGKRRVLWVHSCGSFETQHTLPKDGAVLPSDHNCLTSLSWGRWWIYYHFQKLWCVRSCTLTDLWDSYYKETRTKTLREYCCHMITAYGANDVVTKARGSAAYIWWEWWISLTGPVQSSIRSLLQHVHCSCLRHVTRSSPVCIWSTTPELPLAAVLKLAYWPLWNAFWEYSVFDLALWGQCCLWSSDAAMRSSCRPHLSSSCKGTIML